jgi:hypothetical protein
MPLCGTAQTAEALSEMAQLRPAHVDEQLGFMV